MNDLEALRPSDVHPDADQVERQRRALQAHIAAEPRTATRRGRHGVRRLAIFAGSVGVALGAGGGSLAWALSTGDTSSPPPSGDMTFTACAASASNGSALIYMVVGSVCGPNHVPSENVYFGQTPHQYCMSGPQGDTDKVLVVGSTACPKGYEVDPSAPTDFGPPTPASSPAH